MLFVANKQQLEALIKDDSDDQELLEELEETVEEETLVDEGIVGEMTINEEEEAAWFDSTYHAQVQNGSEETPVHYTEIMDAQGSYEGIIYSAEDLGSYQDHVEAAQKVAEEAREKRGRNQSITIIDAGERHARDVMKDFNPTLWYLMNEDSMKISFN